MSENRSDRIRGKRVGVQCEHSLRNLFGRLLWNLAWRLLYKPSPRRAHCWRRALLRLFGAQVAKGVWLSPSARFWAPWNLTLEFNTAIDDHVFIYNIARVTLREHSVVSVYSFLCSPTHDHSLVSRPLVTGCIEVGRLAWLCADVFVGPGVRVGEGAVVGARSSVYRDVPPWQVVGGNPARFIKHRVLWTEDGARLDPGDAGAEEAGEPGERNHAT